MAGIYIHIPFCKQACHYCDFHFSTQLNNVSELCHAIAREINLQRDYLEGETIETIYFGGGTPSIISEADWVEIFNSISNNFKVEPQAEITVEANPEDLSIEKLKFLRSLGVNRLSVGIQSFDESTLKLLNRSHSAVQAEQSILLARECGFKNISVDLIYAIPNRKEDLLTRDLHKLLMLDVEHLSAYSLTIEEKTVFGKQAVQRKFLPVTDEINARQFELIMKILTDAGYDHYEISNYAKPGYISKHNSNYWRQKKYLGVGPSAHSFDGNSRQSNVPNNNTYVKSLASGTIPALKEILSRENQINEYIMTSLRTSWGCDLSFIKETFHYDLITHQQKSIRSYLDSGLMFLSANTLKLTNLGKLHADKLTSDLFLVA